MFFLKIVSEIIKILKVLTDEKISPRQFSWGIVVGICYSLPQNFTLFSFFILSLLFIFNVSYRAGILAFVVFLPISFIFSPVTNLIGEFFLQQQFLNSFFKQMYNSLWVITSFNNTYTMGSFILSLLLIIPIYFLAKIFILNYRKFWHQKIISSKIFRIIVRNKIISFFINKIAN